MTENSHTAESSSSDRLSPPRPRRWRSVALGLLILLCGVLIGSGGTVIVVHRLLHHAIHHPDELPTRVVKRLRWKLDLSEEQEARIKAIIADRQKAVQAIRREAQPKLEKELDRIRGDVAAALNPGQAQDWKKRFDHLRKLWIPPLPAEETTRGAASEGMKDETVGSGEEK